MLRDPHSNGSRSSKMFGDVQRYAKRPPEMFAIFRTERVLFHRSASHAVGPLRQAFRLQRPAVEPPHGGSNCNAGIGPRLLRSWSRWLERGPSHHCLGRTRPKVDQHASDVVERLRIRLNLAHIWSNKASGFVETTLGLLDLAQHWPRAPQAWSKPAQTWSEVRQIRPTSDHLFAALGQIWPNSGQARATHARRI